MYQYKHKLHSTPNRRLQVAAVIALSVMAGIAGIASTGTAFAAKGGGGGGAVLVASPCVNISSFDSGKISSNEQIRFKATSCSSTPQVLTTKYDDTSWRTLYPDMSCGTWTYTGPTLTLAPGQTQTYSITAPWQGVCNITTSETHVINLRVLANDGSLVTSSITTYYEPSPAEGI
jgi:hypothetical protein